MNKKQIIGIVIFAVLILGIIGIKLFTDTNGPISGNYTQIYVATGGGKEDFLYTLYNCFLISYEQVHVHIHAIKLLIE